MLKKMAYSLLLVLTIFSIALPLKGEAMSISPQSYPVFTEIWTSDDVLIGTNETTTVNMHWGGGITLSYDVEADYGNGYTFERSSTNLLRFDQPTNYYLPSGVSKKTFYLSINVASSGDRVSDYDTLIRKLY